MKKSISFVLAVIMLVTLFPTAAFAEGGNMKASDEIVAFIKSFEGFSSKAYRYGSEEYLTIGYGHYSADVTEDMEISEAEADALLRQDLARAEAEVNQFFAKNNLNYNQNVFDAVLSFTYNIGGAWLRSSNYRIRNYLINGIYKYDATEIADAMGVICTDGRNILPGLIKRRIREARVMLYGDYTGTTSQDFVYLIFNANGGTLNQPNRVKIYPKGVPYGNIPGAYKDGYVLKAWETASGRKVRESDLATDNLSINAIWTNGPQQKYKLAVNGGNGSGSYAEGETVTLTPTGGDFLAWRSGDIRVLYINGVYTMKMPDRNAEITTVKNYTCTGSGCPSAAYGDVGSGYWAHDAIDFVYANDLFKGYSDTVFKPTVTMSRGMLITVLYRLNGSPDISDYSNPFSDVKSSSPYHDAILWGYHNRIANGYADGSFHPDDTLKREQLATFLMRYANYMGYNTNKYADISGYSDKAQISGFADEAVCWAVACGIINGTSESTLSPQDGATRAQVAAMVMRFVKNVVSGAAVQELK